MPLERGNAPRAPRFAAWGRTLRRVRRDGAFVNCAAGCEVRRGPARSCDRGHVGCSADGPVGRLRYAAHADEIGRLHVREQSCCRKISASLPAIALFSAPVAIDGVRQAFSSLRSSWLRTRSLPAASGVLRHIVQRL